MEFFWMTGKKLVTIFKIVNNQNITKAIVQSQSIVLLTCRMFFGLIIYDNMLKYLLDNNLISPK